MTTGPRSELDRALSALARAQVAEDGSWSLVMRARAAFEGARAAEDRQAAMQSYTDFVRALRPLGDHVSAVVSACGEVARVAPEWAVDVAT